MPGDPLVLKCSVVLSILLSNLVLPSLLHGADVTRLKVAVEDVTELPALVGEITIPDLRFESKGISSCSCVQVQVDGKSDVLKIYLNSSSIGSHSSEIRDDKAKSLANLVIDVSPTIVIERAAVYWDGSDLGVKMVSIDSSFAGLEDKIQLSEFSHPSLKAKLVEINGRIYLEIKRLRGEPFSKRIVLNYFSPGGRKCEAVVFAASRNK